MKWEGDQHSGGGQQRENAAGGGHIAEQKGRVEYNEAEAQDEKPPEWVSVFKRYRS